MRDEDLPGSIGSAREIEVWGLDSSRPCSDLTPGRRWHPDATNTGDPLLDARVRSALLEYQQGRRSLESAAQPLAQVRRETGCLELHGSAAAGAAKRALLERIAELVAADASGAGHASTG
jgi:hypothetical protein